MTALIWAAGHWRELPTTTGIPLMNCGNYRMILQ
jgi:hypothetical protein